MLVALIILLAIAASVTGAAYDLAFARAINGGGLSDTYCYALSALPSGGVVVGGLTNGNLATPLSSGSGPNNAFIRKTGPTGVDDWTKQLGGTNYARTNGVTTDADGNVFAAINCASPLFGGTSTTTYDVCLVKYDAAGTLTLSAQTGGANQDNPQAIVVHPTDGTIYIGGHTNSATWAGKAQIGSIDGFWLKYSSAGTLLGVFRYGLYGHELLFTTIAVDSAGNIWGAGYVNAPPSYNGATSMGGKETVIQKMSTDGTVLFTRLIGGTGDDQACSIALDASDNAYITGFTSTTFDGKAVSGVQDSFVAKFSSTGVKAWSRTFGGTGLEDGKGVTVDRDNNLVYATGQTNSPTFHGVANAVTADYGSFYLLALSPTDGSIVSVRLYNGDRPSMGYTVATNGAVVYLAGVSHGSAIFAGQSVTGRQGGVVLKLAGPGSAAPTASPSIASTIAPSMITAAPTTKPSANPSVLPTIIPTAHPTRVPTVIPSADPSTDPTVAPSATPSADPSIEPTTAPSEFPTATPSADPSVEPTTVPSLYPTADPSVDPTVVPSAAPTPQCLQWVLANMGATCSATCSSIARVCSEHYFTKIVTQELFYSMVQSAVNVRTGELLGSAGEYCATGLNALPAAGVPSARSVLVSQDGVTSVANLCSYPTSVADSAALDCDATLSAYAGRRFCPCVSSGCDGSWLLSDTSESCDDACGGVGKQCDAQPLESIYSEADFIDVIASSTNADGTVVAEGSAAEYCTEGINTYAFAEAPAVVTIVAPGAANKTHCTFPTSPAPSNVACSVSYPFVRRFCRCSTMSSPPPARKLRAVPTATLLPVADEVNSPASGMSQWLYGAFAIAIGSAALFSTFALCGRKTGEQTSV